MLTGAAGPSQPAPTEHIQLQRDENPRAIGDVPSTNNNSNGNQNNNHKRDEQKPLTGEDADVSDLSSIGESVEMDYMTSDDDLHDDEETGLTAKQRRQQRRRRRNQRRQLDARIADVKASRRDTLTLGLADKDVLKKLLVNAVLILMWYFFSLSISIVSPSPFSPLRFAIARLLLGEIADRWDLS